VYSIFELWWPLTAQIRRAVYNFWGGIPVDLSIVHPDKALLPRRVSPILEQPRDYIIKLPSVALLCNNKFKSFSQVRTQKVQDSNLVAPLSDPEFWVQKKTLFDQKMSQFDCKVSDQIDEICRVIHINWGEIPNCYELLCSRVVQLIERRFDKPNVPGSSFGRK